MLSNEDVIGAVKATLRTFANAGMLYESQRYIFSPVEPYVAVALPTKVMDVENVVEPKAVKDNAES